MESLFKKFQTSFGGYNSHLTTIARTLQGYPATLEVNKDNKRAIGQELLNLSRRSFRGHLVRFFSNKGCFQARSQPEGAY